MSDYNMYGWHLAGTSRLIYFKLTTPIWHWKFHWVSKWLTCVYTLPQMNTWINPSWSLRLDHSFPLFEQCLLFFFYKIMDDPWIWYRKPHILDLHWSHMPEYIFISCVDAHFISQRYVILIWHCMLIFIEWYYIAYLTTVGLQLGPI